MRPKQTWSNLLTIEDRRPNNRQARTENTLNLAIWVIIKSAAHSPDLRQPISIKCAVIKTAITIIILTQQDLVPNPAAQMPIAIAIIITIHRTARIISLTTCSITTKTTIASLELACSTTFHKLQWHNNRRIMCHRFNSSSQISKLRLLVVLVAVHYNN